MRTSSTTRATARLAFLSLLYLLFAVLADGLAHSITSSALIPASEHGRGVSGGTPLRQYPQSCDADGIGCSLENCVPATTCVDRESLVSKSCDALIGCAACYESGPFCWTVSNDDYEITQVGCGTSEVKESVPLSGGFLDIVPVYTWSSVASSGASGATSRSAPYITATETTSSSRDSFITGTAMLPSMTSSTHASASKNNTLTEDSHGTKSRNVGIAFGVVSFCVLTGLGLWWACRRFHKDRQDQPNPPDNVGPSPKPDAAEPISQWAELEDVSPSRFELEAPSKNSEMNGTSQDPAGLTFPPISPISPLAGDGASGRMSPVSALEPPPYPGHAGSTKDSSVHFAGRYGPGGFLNPEYALRDGMWGDEDDRESSVGK